MKELKADEFYTTASKLRETRYERMDTTYQVVMSKAIDDLVTSVQER